MSKNTNEKKIEMTREEYLEYCINKKNTVTIGNGNTKTGSMCYTMSFPVACCRDDAPCKATCYCCKGRQCMINVQAAYHRNLKIYNTDPMAFWDQVHHKLKYEPMLLFRWFDAGDTPDEKFIDGMVQLAKDFPNIKFLAYTKRYEWYNNWLDKNGSFPDNLTVRFSYWDKNWNKEIDDRHNLPTAYVSFKEPAYNNLPEKFATCRNQKDKLITCSVCQLCWNKKIKNMVFSEH